MLIERLEHNLGKIHEVETVRFRITRYAANGKDIDTQDILEIPGSELRKQGLGKDVTNKFLGGLPGVQKEGCDGIITSAVFILHKNAAAYSYRLYGVFWFGYEQLRTGHCRNH